MSILKNLWILSKNGFVKEEKRTLNDSIRFLIKLFLFLFLVKILYLGLTLLINSSDTITLPVISNDFKFDRYSGIQKFFLGALLAPIFEELTFRLGLKFSKRNILMLFAGITYSILKLIIQLDWNTSLLIVAMTTLTLGLILNNKILDILAEFWKNNRLVIFYFLLLSFALFHSTNYDLDFSTLLYIPIIMLPHFLAGLIYSYARLKSGIILTIFLHILNNALFAFPLLFAD